MVSKGVTKWDPVTRSRSCYIVVTGSTLDQSMLRAISGSRLPINGHDPNVHGGDVDPSTAQIFSQVYLKLKPVRKQKCATILD